MLRASMFIISSFQRRQATSVMQMQTRAAQDHALGNGGCCGVPLCLTCGISKSDPLFSLSQFWAIYSVIIKPIQAGRRLLLSSACFQEHIRGQIQKPQTKRAGGTL